MLGLSSLDSAAQDAAGRGAQTPRTVDEDLQLDSDDCQGQLGAWQGAWDHHSGIGAARLETLDDGLLQALREPPPPSPLTASVSSAGGRNDAALASGAQVVVGRGEGDSSSSSSSDDDSEDEVVSRSVLGSWVGVRRPFLPFLVPHRVSHGFYPKS